MSLGLALAVAGGAAVGAPVRYLLAQRLDREGFPWGTGLVNVLGSGLLGAVAGLALTGVWWALLAVGFAGAVTTYSSFAVQLRGLIQHRGVLRALLYAAATVGLGLAACALGYVAASPLR